MKMKDENMEWENEAPILAALPKVTPYRVPEKYFDDLTTQVNAAVFLADLDKEEGIGFTVPAAYFETLNDRIQGRISLEQFSSPSLNEGFKTPADYFDKLNANILSQTVNLQEKTKVVRLWNSDFLRYAVAACFIFITGSTIYLNQRNTVPDVQGMDIASEQLLYDIDESVIIEHLNESQTATNKSASKAEMESYILDHYSATDLSNNL